MTDRLPRIHVTQLQVPRVLHMYIKQCRSCKNINQLSKRAGIAPGTITRILEGQPDLRFSTLAFLCDALGVSLKEFMEHAEAKKPIKYQKLVFVP